MRQPRKNKTYKLDLTKPVDKTDFFMKDGDCFGKEWDMSSKECPTCADRDICAILFKDKVDKKTKEIEHKQGSYFLDRANLAALTDTVLFDFIECGKTNVQDFISFGVEKSKCSDVTAVKNNLKAFIRRHGKVYVKNGVIWIK